MRHRTLIPTVACATLLAPLTAETHLRACPLCNPSSILYEVES